MSQIESPVVIGVVKFYNRADLKKYLKGLVELYQGEANQYGDNLGSLIRTSGVRKPADGKEQPKPQAKGWVKMGSLIVNMSDPLTSMTEIMYQLHEEFKQKLAKTAEALKSYEDVAAANIPDGVSLVLQLRNGIPEKIVVDSQSMKRDSFRYSGKFRLV